LLLILENDGGTSGSGADAGNAGESAGSGKNERADHDGMWKDLIGRFFYPLLKRALPELYNDADTGTEPRSLDKEFRDILNTADPEIHASPHFADLVMEVPLKNGENEWVLLHIEAQGRGGGNLPERMNHYRCLIYAHYRREPAALAIITDARREAREYSHSRYGTEAVYRYNNIVLGELGDDELLSGDSPIDLALYAAKAAARGGGDHQKYRYLRTAAGLLAERGWDMNDKRDLMLFIERMLYLKDRELKRLHWEYRSQLDREGKVMYEHFLKSVEEEHAEQRGIEKGIVKGIEKGKQEVARNLLANGVSPEIITRSTGISPDDIRRLMI
jgi:predicted transposase YdaD